MIITSRYMRRYVHRPAFTYFGEKKSSLIFLSDTPVTCYLNARKRVDGFWRGKPLQFYLDTEFSPQRTEIYELGKKVVMTDLTLDQRREELGRVLEGL